jgi:hypothetical protein
VPRNVGPLNQMQIEITTAPGFPLAPVSEAVFEPNVFELEVFV